LNGWVDQGVIVGTAMRHVIANLLLFIAYCGSLMLLDWNYVRRGQPHDSMLEPLVAAFLWTSLPLACFVNWKLLSIANPKNRLVMGIVLGLAAFVVGYVLCALIGIYFHLWIGGTL
jgi:uncharacterized membrane protein